MTTLGERWHGWRQERSMDWFGAWTHLLWPVFAACLAYEGGWFAVAIVVLYATTTAIADRLIYWQERRIITLKERIVAMERHTSRSRYAEGADK